MKSFKATADIICTAPSDHIDVRRPRVGQLERLPKWLNLIPMVTQWAWLSLKYGSVTLPSAANPAILSGGMVGEGKLDYFSTMGPHARSMTADYTSIIPGRHTIDDALMAMAAANLDFPVIVKPDVGWCGFGVRCIHSAGELARYIALYPVGETLVLQRYLPWEGEAGIFYARHPDEPAGRVIGILLRSFPRVTGDGKSTIAGLMAKDARLARLGADGLHECTHNPDYIPALAETIRLATIGSTRVGGLYRDGSSSITPALTAEMDRIAKDMRDFHIGRFDVRYESLEQLREGTGFKIMEVNGAGSEAVHAWDPKFNLFQSYAIVFAKQRLLFKIAAAMRARGHKPISAIKLAKLHLWQQSLIKRYPPSN